MTTLDFEKNKRKRVTHPISIGKVTDQYRRQNKLANKNRSTNPIEEGKADLVQWYLYDRVTTAASSVSATEYDFFTAPIGQNNKTKADTNLEQVSRLPDPQHMDVVSLQFYFSSNMIKVDIDTFLNTYYCEFWVGTKIYAEGPIQKFPGGAGLAATSTQTNVGTWANGLQSPGAVVDLRLPNQEIGIHILQGQTFKVKVFGTGFTLNASGAGLNLMCYLEGILSRGVQ